MTDRPTRSADAAQAVADPMTRFFRDAIEAQERAVTQAQSWAVNIMSAYREQAEDHSALLQSVNRSLRAAEDLLESQTKATKALSESLEASRQLMETLAGSHQRGLDRLQAMVTDAVEQVSGRLQPPAPPAGASDTPTSPLNAPNATYLQLTNEWLDALNRFMSGGGGAAGPDTATPKAH
jgi:hypothetical protein